MSETYSVADHFINKNPGVKELYDQLIKKLKAIGPIEEDPKKTSIHLNRNSALAGVETRKDYLLLNIKSDHKIENSRIEKLEQVSARRFHHKVRITSSKDLDAELMDWLKEAYLSSE